MFMWDGYVLAYDVVVVMLLTGKYYCVRNTGKILAFKS